MRIKYQVINDSIDFESERSNNAIEYRWAEDRRKIKEPITITLHVEIDKERYEKIKQKFKTTLADRIFSYFGF